MNIKLGDTSWVEFKYENLLGFYFYCGKVGHGDKSCKQRKKDVKKCEIKNNQFGE